MGEARLLIGWRSFCVVAWVALMLLSGCQRTKRIEGFPKKYAGVGLELTADAGTVRVVRPILGGPSDAAGIKGGDVITAINGTSTEGMTLGDVVQRLRGKPDSQLSLSLDRSGEHITVVLRRQKISRQGADYRPAK